MKPSKRIVDKWKIRNVMYTDQDCWWIRHTHTEQYHLVVPLSPSDCIVNSFTSFLYSIQIYWLIQRQELAWPMRIDVIICWNLHQPWIINIMDQYQQTESSVNALVIIKTYYNISHTLLQNNILNSFLIVFLTSTKSSIIKLNNK